MRLLPNTLKLEIKIQDRYREWFSSLGQEDALQSSCVILGDSDVDYSIAPNISKTRILSAPFNVEGIKHKLIYNGVGKNLSGLIKCFARRVNSTGDIESIYDYPTTNNFILGLTPPTLENGNNFEQITFTNAKMGYILFFSTVLDYYVTDTGVKKRLVEEYTFSIDWNGATVTPANWDFVVDNINGSMLISKNELANSVGSLYNCTITAKGKNSNKIKKIKFNL